MKVLWWDGAGLCLFAKRLERGRFIWPQATSGVVHLSVAQLSMLLEGIDWRRPVRTHGAESRVLIDAHRVAHAIRAQKKFAHILHSRETTRYTRDVLNAS